MKIRIPHDFTPRKYQIWLFKALDRGITRAIIVRHRRAWKDKTCFNLMVKKATERIWIYYYIFPTYSQWRKAIWDWIDKDGKKTLEHIPSQLIKSSDKQQMKIELKNGSIIQIVWSDNIDSIVGTNPVGIIFSEYSLQSPAVWDFMRPILAENGWRAIFNFTPRWDNHAKELLDMAKDDEKRYVSIRTVDDTKAVSQDVLEQEREEIIAKNGDDAIFQQEYYCSFDAGLQWAYYAIKLSQIEKEGHRCLVPYDEALDVHTIRDLWINDSTSIIFFQRMGKEIRIIDFYENSGEALNHYAGVMREKWYRYGTCRLPHDAQSRSLQTGKTVEEKLTELGVENIKIIPRLGVMEGINYARSILSYCRFDKEKTERLRKCLKNYHKKYDEKRKSYGWPDHDRSSHASDAFRYLWVISEEFRWPVRQYEAVFDNYV